VFFIDSTPHAGEKAWRPGLSSAGSTTTLNNFLALAAGVKSSTPTTPPTHSFSSSFSGSFCQTTYTMSDEVYEGAIGIDLGAHFRKNITPQCDR
jgi:hypothetical protein